MPRIRTIKPEWIEDERFNACSDAAMRLAHVFYALVDDDGRCKVSVRALGLAGWKFCDRVTDKTAHAQAAVDELVASRWLISYVANGEQYWCIRNFAKHQVIAKYKPSRLPPPPDQSGTSPDEYGSRTEPVQESSSTTPVPVPNPSGMVAVDLDLDQGSGRDRDRIPARETGTPVSRPKPIDRFAQSLAVRPKPAEGMLGIADAELAFSEARVELKRGRFTNPGQGEDHRLAVLAEHANASGTTREERLSFLKAHVREYLSDESKNLKDARWPLSFLTNDPGRYDPAETCNAPKPTSDAEAAWLSAKQAHHDAFVARAAPEVLYRLEQAEERTLAALQAYRRGAA